MNLHDQWVAAVNSACAAEAMFGKGSRQHAAACVAEKAAFDKKNAVSPEMFHAMNDLYKAERGEKGDFLASTANAGWFTRSLHTSVESGTLVALRAAGLVEFRNLHSPSLIRLTEAGHAEVQG